MDRTPVKKAVNQLKATIDRRQGPASKSQDAVPIADAMRDYWECGMPTFAMRAHGGARGPAPEFARWAGLEAARFDLPMSHGVDTRDRAWQVQSTAQELFAEAVGAKQVLFSTNGSSMSVHSR
jgi:arginine decarboxylase